MTQDGQPEYGVFRALDIGQQCGLFKMLVTSNHKSDWMLKIKKIQVSVQSSDCQFELQITTH